MCYICIENKKKKRVVEQFAATKKRKAANVFEKKKDRQTETRFLFCQRSQSRDPFSLFITMSFPV